MVIPENSEDKILRQRNCHLYGPKLTVSGHHEFQNKDNFFVDIPVSSGSFHCFLVLNICKVGHPDPEV